MKKRKKHHLSPKGTGYSGPVAKRKSTPLTEYLASLILQYFDFIEECADGQVQQEKLMELDALWKAWLQRNKLLYNAEKHDNDFIGKVGFYLKQRVELAKKRSAKQTQPAPELGIYFEGF